MQQRAARWEDSPWPGVRIARTTEASYHRGLLLTFEQQHIAAVKAIVPTPQNVVATVNLHPEDGHPAPVRRARNAEV